TYTTPPTTPHPPEPHTPIPTTPWHHTHHWTPLGVGPATDNPTAQPEPATVPSDWRYELTWPVHDRRPDPDTEIGPWLVIGDAEFGAHLSRAVGAETPVAVANPDRITGDPGATLADGGRPARQVVYIPPATPVRFDADDAYRLFTTLRDLAVMLAAMPAPPTLYVLTRNAQPVAEGDRTNPAPAVLWGLARTLAVEHPEIWGRIIDVDDSLPDELIAEHLLAEARARDNEDQIVYRAGRRHLPRLVRSATPPRPAAAPAHGTCQLVVGATGTVGHHLIGQLARMGAATVVALARHPEPHHDVLAATLAGTDTRLVTVAADAADPAAMSALFARFGDDLPPLDGIHLAAMAGRPVLVDDMTADDVTAMFRPKLDALSVLHRLTLTTPVRQFVLYSSITGLIGSRWLGHYTAAGAYLDAFAYARRGLGLPATVIDWGLWQTTDTAATADVGLRPMPGAVAITAVPGLLAPDAAARGIVVDADWTRLAAAYRMRCPLHIIDELVPAVPAEGPAPDTAPHWRTIKKRVESAVAGPEPATLLGEHVRIDTSPPVHLWQAWLRSDAKPYPGGHRVRGVEVVPVSVLMATLAAAARACAVAAIADLRFDYPVVLDAARLIQVVADGVTLSIVSAPSPDAPADRWTTHATATAAAQPPGAPVPADPPAGTRELSLADLQEQDWQVDGRPFDWAVDSCRTAPARLWADISTAESPPAVLLDAAVHLARLAGRDDTRLLLPASVEAVYLSDRAPGTGFHIDVQRHDRGEDLVTTVTVTDPDGTVLAEIGALRFTAADPGPAADPGEPPRTAAWDWSGLSATEMRPQLQDRLRAVLARELGMAPEAVDVERPFPELGLDSMMAMTVLREAKQMLGVELSATTLWNHPTVAAMSGYLTDMLATGEPDLDDHREPEPEKNLLDELFDSVEAGAGGEGRKTR
ncbi:SDR family NAD(P)-dependent oxidoreductase, partial [Mycolicibacillus trivialis]